jgi:hypothetical protein
LNKRTLCIVQDYSIGTWQTLFYWPKANLDIKQTSIIVQRMPPASTTQKRIVNGNLLSGDAWLQPIFRQLLLPARQPPLPKPRFYTRKVVCLSDQPIR